MVLIHASLALAAVFLMVAGGIVALFMRKKRWWFKVHKFCELAGLFVLVSAVAGAVTMVQSWQGSHFDSPHGYLGVALVFLAMLAVVLGYLQLKAGARRPLARFLHRTCGYLVLSLMVVNAFGGLSVAGLLPWN